MTDDDLPMPAPEGDLVLLLEACAARLGDEVLARVRSELGADIRYRDGYVFQHLIQRPRSVSDLARRLGVTQQAASKQVADLADRGLVSRHRDPDDGRSWLISLSPRGQRAVQAGREARTDLADELLTDLGGTTYHALVEHLASLSTNTGALAHLLDRRLRPEAGR
ncbi:MAG: MarR family transcriptional regulator [Actinomycetota bacterium]